MGWEHASMIDRSEVESDQLELLSIQIKHGVKYLRDPDVPYQLKYAMLYELRTRLGHIVARLGMGQPKSADLSKVRKELERA